MHNQSVNSLAFISARKTIDANETLSLLLSSQLYCIMQAIDLRIMYNDFLSEVRSLLEATLAKHFGDSLSKSALVNLTKACYITLIKRLEETSSSESSARFVDAASMLVGVIVEVLSTSDNPSALKAVTSWRTSFASSASQLYVSMLDDCNNAEKQVTAAKSKLGRTSSVYELIRGSDVNVAFRRGDVAQGKSGKSIGSSVSSIVEAMRDGRLVAAAGKAFMA